MVYGKLQRNYCELWFTGQDRHTDMGMDKLGSGLPCALCWRTLHDSETQSLFICLNQGSRYTIYSCIKRQVGGILLHKMAGCTNLDRRSLKGSSLRLQSSKRRILGCGWLFLQTLSTFALRFRRGFVTLSFATPIGLSH